MTLLTHQLTHFVLLRDRLHRSEKGHLRILEAGVSKILQTLEKPHFFETNLHLTPFVTFLTESLYCQKNLHQNQKHLAEKCNFSCRIPFSYQNKQTDKQAWSMVVITPVSHLIIVS